MADQLLDKDGKPIKPADPPSDTPAIPEDHVAVPKADLDDIKRRLDVFEKATQFAPQHAPQPAPEPQGPTLADQVKEIDGKISEIGKQIDDAVDKGKPVSEMLAKRDNLITQKIDLTTDSKIGAFREQGLSALEQITTRVMADQMPHLDLVRTEFDHILSSLAPGARSNPEAVQAAYNLAVGSNVDKIVAAKVEEQLRADTPPPNDPGGTPPGRQGGSLGGGGDTIPSPQEILSPENLAAIEMSKHRNIDSYYQSLGYEGWEDHYEKNKSFYTGEPEGEA
jgi:hypothetical protein